MRARPWPRAPVRCAAPRRSQGWRAPRSAASACCPWPTGAAARDRGGHAEPDGARHGGPGAVRRGVRPPSGPREPTAPGDRPGVLRDAVHAGPAGSAWPAPTTAAPSGTSSTGSRSPTAWCWPRSPTCAELGLVAFDEPEIKVRIVTDSTADLPPEVAAKPTTSTSCRSPSFSGRRSTRTASTCGRRRSTSCCRTTSADTRRPARPPRASSSPRTARSSAAATWSPCTSRRRCRRPLRTPGPRPRRAARTSSRLRGDGAPGLEVVDSLQVSTGLALLAVIAARLAMRRLDASEIRARIETMRPRIHLLFVVDTLEYLARGGRIGQAQAWFGGLLGIKPILGVVNGEVVPVDRVRGGANAQPRLVALLKERVDAGPARHRGDRARGGAGVGGEAAQLAARLLQDRGAAGERDRAGRRDPRRSGLRRRGGLPAHRGRARARSGRRRRRPPLRRRTARARAARGRVIASGESSSSSSELESRPLARMISRTGLPVSSASLAISLARS